MCKDVMWIQKGLGCDEIFAAGTVLGTAAIEEQERDKKYIGLC